MSRENHQSHQGHQGHQGHQSRRTRRSLLALAAVVVTMFAFGYALVPMYRTICQLTGLNGRSSSLTQAAAVTNVVADPQRTVTVQFTTTVNGSGAWNFDAEQAQIRVHPGEAYTVYFDATNRRDRPIVGQAVPSVTPWLAAGHLHKTECFCFTQQAFAGNEHKRMPVRFMIDPGLPPEVDTLTLSYTFFDVSGLAAAARGAPSS